MTAVFSQNGAWMLTASFDETAKLWDVESGECLKTFEGHHGAVLSAAFSHDSARMLTASDDGTAKLWDVESGVCLKEFESDEFCILSASAALF